MGPEQLDLLSYKYPLSPGYKARSTSRDAAASMRGRGPRLRESALRIITRCPSTADECAAELCRSVLSIRPRVAELAAQGLIIDTGITRKNSSGRPAIVWKAKAATADTVTA